MTEEKNVHHDQAFYDEMKTCRPAYRLLGELMHEALPVKTGTLLDIGCGTGAQTSRLASLGFLATGVDPFDTTPDPGFLFVRRDILENPFTVPFDVVVCTETAEHIYEDRADRIVEVVATSALKAIVWSAAQPGQEYPGHVNLQDPPYWLEKFARYGLTPDWDRTDQLRNRMLATRAQHWSCRTNFHIMVKS